MQQSAFKNVYKRNFVLSLDIFVFIVFGIFIKIRKTIFSWDLRMAQNMSF